MLSQAWGASAGWKDAFKDDSTAAHADLQFLGSPYANQHVLPTAHCPACCRAQPAQIILNALQMANT
jgi:hypothetical protein